MAENDTLQSDPQGQRISVPTMIRKKQHAFYILAGVALLCAVVFILLAKDVKALMVICFPAYSLWKGFDLQRKWGRGEIKEIAVRCQQVRPSMVRNRVLLTFVTLDKDEPSFFQFAIPGVKQADNYIVGSNYIIYFDENEPKILISALAV